VLPENADPLDVLGMDRFLFISYDDTFGFRERVLEETDETITVADRNGALSRLWKKRSDRSLLPISYLIKTEEDWFSYNKLLEPSEKRLEENFLQEYENLRKRDGFLCLNQREPCWKVLAAIMGLENGLKNMLQKSELIYNMIGTYADLLIEMYKIMVEQNVEIDGVWLRGDLCYKNDMLFSPKVYDRLVYPHHKRIADFFNARKIPVIQHCDGDVRQYIPLIIKAGFKAIQPLEAKANNDIRELKKKWGDKIAFIGNINVIALSGSKKEIEEVRSKILVAKEGGGYVFHSDHSIPPTVSWENYF